MSGAKIIAGLQEAVELARADSAAASGAWDSAELPAPVPAGCGMEPRVTAHLFDITQTDAHVGSIAREAFAPLASAIIARPPLPADLSPNQMFLHARCAMENLERLIPVHDGPLLHTPDLALLIRAQAGDIAAALVGILTLPQMEPETDAE